MVLPHASGPAAQPRPRRLGFHRADLRDPAGILEMAARTLDFTAPVALMLLAVMQFIPDEEDPHALVSTLRDALARGSYLVLSYPTDDFNPNKQGESIKRVQRAGHRPGHAARPRDDREVLRLLPSSPSEAWSASRSGAPTATGIRDALLHVVRSSPQAVTARGSQGPARGRARWSWRRAWRNW